MQIPFTIDSTSRILLVCMNKDMSSRTFSLQHWIVKNANNMSNNRELVLKKKITVYIRSLPFISPWATCRLSLFFYCLQAKNGFHNFRGWRRRKRRKKKKRTCNRELMWPGKPKVFIMWIFVEIAWYSHIMDTNQTMKVKIK